MWAVIKFLYSSIMFTTHSPFIKKYISFDSSYWLIIIYSGVANEVPSFCTIDSIIFSSFVKGFSIFWDNKGFNLFNYFAPGILFNYCSAKSRLFVSSSAFNSMIFLITGLYLIFLLNTKFWTWIYKLGLTNSRNKSKFVYLILTPIVIWENSLIASERSSLRLISFIT